MASAPNHMMDAARAPCISSLPFSPPHSLSPLSPALYVSVWEQGRGTLSPNYLIVVRLYHLSSLLGSDTIFTLTSYWARFFFHSFCFFFPPLPSQLYPLFPFPCCSLHWHTPLPYPPELSIHRDCKANAWDFLKQTASILCCSPICG